MSRKITDMIKGISILIMIAHHFLIYGMGGVSSEWIAFGQGLKICVAIYAVLSGYGYFFAKDKTLKYGLKKISGLLQIYWLSLFTLFFPAALLGGWKLTPKEFFIQLFALYPNLNWFAWYVFFYIFCMIVMPCVYRRLRYSPLINLGIGIIVPYAMMALLYCIPHNAEITIIHDLISCMAYFPCFLIGYLLAENKIIEKFENISLLQSPIICFIGISILIGLRCAKATLFIIQLDTIYAPLFVCFAACMFDKICKYKQIRYMFSILGKYSAGMWFFHAVFFSTYICDWFQPILQIVAWPPLLYIWLVLLSFIGAYIYQRILDGIHSTKVFQRRV